MRLRQCCFQACLAIIQACLAVQKAAARVLMAPLLDSGQAEVRVLTHFPHKSAASALLCYVREEEGRGGVGLRGETVCVIRSFAAVLSATTRGQ